MWCMHPTRHKNSLLVLPSVLDRLESLAAASLVCLPVRGILYSLVSVAPNRYRRSRLLIIVHPLGQLWHLGRSSV